MKTNYDLSRFLEAQEQDYDTALKEVQRGKKLSHWMWYIFPQISGLGFSDTSKFYAIKNINEAYAFLQHEVLGTRLINICNELLKLPINDPVEIFGKTDALKLRSSMTLFSSLNQPHQVFQRLLDKFYNGRVDERTMTLIDSFQE